MEARSSSSEPIAIVGLACRFPQAPDPQAFWRLLAEGRSAVTRVPPERWPVSGADEPGAAAFGAFLDRVDGFDAAFFGISPREAATMDPQQRLMLELGWEALEHAGIAAGDVGGTATGVFVGAIGDDYGRLLDRQGPEAIDRHTLSGLNRGMIANRLSHALGLRGPSLCVDCAQASALVAVHLACQSLRCEECELALAGGINLNLIPESAIAVQRFGGLSADGRCFTFDERANGYVRGEGGGVVALKRLEEAIGDGDRLLGVILGSAVNEDGAGETLTAPSESAQAAVLRLAYERAGVDPSAVHYVELHGSGTPAGDPVEAAALGAALGSRRPAESPLRVGSVKTNIGHLEGAAGIAGLAKAVLAIDRGALPPSLNFERANPRIPLDALNLTVQTELEPWPARDGEQLLAGVSSFGMGGTNCHLVLASPLPASRSAAGADAPPPLAGIVAWPLSAKAGPALREQAARLLRFADEEAADPLEIARSLLRRSSFEHRAVALGGTRDALLEGLDAVAGGRGSAAAVTGRARGAGRPVFVFPGQGSQWPEMARGLLGSAPPFCAAVEECCEALAPHLDWSLDDVLQGRDGAASLDRIEVVQPALFAMMVSLARLWRACGVEPGAVVGHSQGEIAAAHIAGGLSLDDAARLTALRARLISRLAGQGAMASVVMPPGELGSRLRRWQGRIEVAARNSPSTTILSAERDALEEFLAQCAADEVWAREIPATIPSHSARVEPLRAELLAGLESISPRSGEVPFHSTVTGEVLDTARLDADYWYRNLRQPVRFEQVTRAFLAQGHRLFVEISPHPVSPLALQETIEDALANRERTAVLDTLRRGDGGLGRFVRSLAEAHVAGVEVEWERLLAETGTRHLPLPTYPFQRQRYWLDAEQPSPEAAEPRPEPDFEARLATLPAAERPGRVLELVRSEVAAMLGHDSVAAVEPGVAFTDLGLDSLGAVELRNRLEAATGLDLDAKLAIENPMSAALAERLLAELDPDP